MTCCPLPRAPWVALALVTAAACSDESSPVVGDLEDDLEVSQANFCTIPDAYVAYWFAWFAFHPTTGIWPDLGDRESDLGR